MPPRDLRRTVEAIVWRHANGAKWRAIPAELGPWWRAGPLFIRLFRLRGGGGVVGAGSSSAWRSSTGPRSGRTPRPRVRPKKGDLARTGPARGARPLARRLRHQGVRDRRRAGARGRLRAGPGPSARAAGGARAPRPAPPRAAVGRRRSRLQLARLPRAGPGQRRTARDPDQGERGGRGLPRLHLRQPQPRRTSLGPAQGMARGRDPVREDRDQLPRRPPPRRHDGLAQALTGPRADCAAIGGPGAAVGGWDRFDPDRRRAMPRADSTDLRERALAACEAGGGRQSEVARRYRVGERTLSGWLKLAREEGRRHPKPRRGGRAPLGGEREALAALVRSGTTPPWPSTPTGSPSAPGSGAAPRPCAGR